KDDLSITLNYNNEDFFVDTRKYSYTRNKTRNYITSRKAHSGYYMTSFDYTIKNENRFDRKISLENYYENDHFTLVKGFNNNFDGSSAKLTRHVVQFKKKNIVVLIDNLLNNRRHNLKLNQNFNLATNVSIEGNDNEVKLTSNETTLTVKQFNNLTNSEVVKGDLERPVAVNSTGFAKVEKTNQLKYQNETNEKNAFLTAVYDETNIKDINIKIENSTVKITFNDEEYYIYI